MLISFDAKMQPLPHRLSAKRSLGVWAAEHFDRIPTEPFDTVFDSPLLFVEFVS